MANWNKNFKFIDPDGHLIKEIKEFQKANQNRGFWNKQFRIPEEINEPDPNIYFDEEGNEFPMADSSADNSKDVEVKVPFTHIGFSGKDSEERPTPVGRESRKPNVIKGKASFKGSASIKAKATVEVKSPFENKEPDLFGKNLQSWCRILPKKFREEYIGDLLEDRENLKKRGLPEWKVNLITFGNVFFLLITSRWIWFQGLFQSAFKFFKEFIQ